MDKYDKYWVKKIYYESKGWKVGKCLNRYFLYCIGYRDVCKFIYYIKDDVHDTIMLFKTVEEAYKFIANKTEEELPISCYSK